MALSKEVVNNQIAEATAKLEARKVALKGKSFDDARIEKDTIYKSLRSNLKEVKKRLAKIEKLEARDADLKK